MPRARPGIWGRQKVHAPEQQEVGTCSNHEVTVVHGTEGRGSQDVQGVYQDQGPREVLPALGDGVLHLVQADVQFLMMIL